MVCDTKPLPGLFCKKEAQHVTMGFTSLGTKVAMWVSILIHKTQSVGQLDHF